VAEQILALAEGPAPGELERSKAQMKGGLFMSRESPLSRAEQAAGQVLLFDRIYTSAELAEAVEEVSADDLRRVAARILAPGAVATAILGPKAALKAPEGFARRLQG
jgi:predicted Zn-dependent peptidase